METNEAIKRIDEISKIIESSNKVLFSGERMMVIGFMVALIPALEWATQYMTFGHDFGTNSTFLITLIHTVFYWALFALVGKFLPWTKMDRTDMHPLIRKTFALTMPILISIFGVVFIFASIGQAQLIHPVVFLLLGFLFSIYGKFSIPAVSYIAWSYIFVGLIYAYLTQYNLPNAWVYFTVYNGLSYVLMGYFLRKARAIP